MMKTVINSMEIFKNQNKLKAKLNFINNME